MSELRTGVCITAPSFTEAGAAAGREIETLRRVLKAFASIYGIPAVPDWTDFLLARRFIDIGPHLIRLALTEKDGLVLLFAITVTYYSDRRSGYREETTPPSRHRNCETDDLVTNATKLLGVSHQHLISLLSQSHKDLLSDRSPVGLRRKSIIKSPAARRHLPSKKPLAVRTIRILHVEGNQAVVDAVRDMLESDGWNIETCADGTEKLKTIAGDTYYDLLLFDNSLPGINGLNLLQQVRRMPHRLHTPIVILLSDPIGDEGLRAGANAVLLKPEDIYAIAETITRLLKTASKTAEHRPADPGPRIDYNPSHKCLESRSLILTVSLLWFNFRIARDSRATR